MRIDLYLLDVDCGWLVFKCLGLAAPVFAAPGRLFVAFCQTLWYGICAAASPAGKEAKAWSFSPL